MVIVLADAAVGDHCATPYTPPPAMFTLNGKTYPLSADGVLVPATQPGSFVAFYH